MLFWVHIAAAYLVYRLGEWAGFWDYDNTTLAICLFAATVPDLVDKPLALMFSGLPSRAIAHSLFAAFIIIILASASKPSSQSKGTVFIVGYFSHIGADLIDVVAIPRETIGFLFWPVDTSYHGIGSLFDTITLNMPFTYLLLQLGLTILAVVLYGLDRYSTAELP